MAYQMAPLRMTLNDLEGYSFAAWNVSKSDTSGNEVCIIYAIFTHKSESTRGL